MAHDLVTELLQYSSLACFMPIRQLCANLLIPNCLRSNLSYSPLATLELYVIIDNSLNANNERHIVENLNTFYQGKTVMIVAHRLSTVKNADQIIVLDHGKVVEVGNHESLTLQHGAYYNLVKNQLELGS